MSIFEYICFEIIRIHHEYQGGIGKSVPRITDWHHEDCRVMTIGGRECFGFFYSILSRIMDSFSCSTLHTSFILEKLEQDFQKILNTLRCDILTSFLHYNDVTDRRADSVRLFVFLSFLRAGTGV